jgi:hypothetical protein
MKTTRLASQFIAAVTTLSLCTRMCLADTRVAARFLNDYPAAYEKLVASTERVKGCLAKTIVDVDGTVLNGGMVRFSTDHGMWKAECDGEEDGKKVAAVVCSGGEKQFVLGKNEGKDAYFIADARRSNYVGNLKVYSEIREHCAASYSIGGRPMIDIIRAPGFKVTDATTTVLDGENCVRITYVSEGTLRGANATVTFDPASGWTIRQASIRTNASAVGIGGKERDAGNVSIDLVYDPLSEVKAIPTRMTIESPYYKEKRVYTFSDVRVEGTPIEEFTMAHYGVTDINWDYDKDVLKETQQAGFFWFSVLVVAVLSLAVAWRRLHSRGVNRTA